MYAISCSLRSTIQYSTVEGTEFTRKYYTRGGGPPMITTILPQLHHTAEHPTRNLSLILLPTGYLNAVLLQQDAPNPCGRLSEMSDNS